MDPRLAEANVVDSRQPQQVSIPGHLLTAFELSWQRFCDNADEAMVRHALARDELKFVWCASDFISGWCIRNPDQLDRLIEQGTLDQPCVPAALQQQLIASGADCHDEAALDKALRLFRQREMVCLAWRDLAGFSTVEETMAGVSVIAEASIALALDKHSQWLMERFGTPRDENGESAHMVVLGLGKLGGHELNYSSDIDLMFSYDNPGRTDGKRRIDNQEFFIKLGRKLIGSLDRVDADGFVFRTDMRLRPNGESGPIALSFAAMEHYYQTHGRDWERYALIKARVVAGNRDSGAALLAMLRPFIYRKYLDFSAFDALREMKTLIERQLQSSGNIGDIKLGRGGIREIEFLVQNHQLIRGGREVNLQTTRLYEAMSAMVRLGLLSEEEQATLTAAYRFLRNVEHRLQMVADRQTQKLPEQAQERGRIAMAMCYEHWDGFKQALAQHQEKVHQLFEDLLQSPDDADNNPELMQLTALWLGQLDAQSVEQTLAGVGFQHIGELPSLLHEFRGGKLYQAYASIDKDRLDRLMPLALQAAGKMLDAERGIRAFVAVIEAIGRRSVYLSLLIENPIALNQLLVLCAASQWISRHIGRYPVILDELLQPMDRYEVPGHAAMRADLDHRLSQVEDDDEGRMNALREFYHAQVLRIASADIRKLIKSDQVQNGLTRLAEVILEVTLQEAIDRVQQKQGPAPGQVAIIAYGKFAGRELGYHSDLDIVVCFEAAEGASATAAEYFFSRVGQRLVHLLTTRTHAGILYELDMRLRPSGRSGTLVTSLNAFQAYQLKSAWTWEHQALVRARIAVGPQQMTDMFEQIRRNILAAQRDVEKLKSEITEMRDRMTRANCQSDETHYDIKLGEGGIVDIEFLLQFLVLAHCADSPQLAEPRNTFDLIETLRQAGLLQDTVAEQLAATYQQYLSRSLELKLMDRPVVIAQTEMHPQRQQITALWQSTFG